MPEVKPFERLPTEAIPKKYTLRLQPNLVKCTFKGSVDIDIEVSKFISRSIY